MQITTISFFRFDGWRNRFWALSQMGIAPLRLGKIQGLQFIKFLGSGAGNGFSIRANLGTYGILCIWDKEEDAQAFFQNHNLPADYAAHSIAQQTVYLRNTMSHGQWDGRNPFVATSGFDPSEPVAVITRATIKLHHLFRFWKKVPSVSLDATGRPGLRFAIGIGELPLVQQATFSIWESGRQMMDYAYKGVQHHAAIQQTRALQWYKEELFARFVPYKSTGEGILHWVE